MSGLEACSTSVGLFQRKSANCGAGILPAIQISTGREPRTAIVRIVG